MMKRLRGQQESVETDTSKPGCKICSIIFGNSDKRHYTFEHLKKSAKGGCKFCNLICEAIKAFCEADDLIEGAFLIDSQKPLKLKLFFNRRPNQTIQLFSNIEEDARHPYFEALKVGIKDSGSDEGLEQLQHWYADCMEGGWSHKECQSSLDEVLPDRLVEVLSSEKTDRLKLVETKKDERGSFTALSHCWGEHKANFPPSTFKANIESHKEGLTWESLSKTFQDAVRLTRYLGIRYIWIDSLCIVQDDEKDWLTQAPQMGLIYSRASLTIAAARAANGGMGCFSRRGNVMVGTVKAKGKQSNIYARVTSGHPSKYSTEQPESVAGNPLYGRGWCLQERYLSPRLVRYEAAEMSWLCKSANICECSGKSDVPGASFLNRLNSKIVSGSKSERRKLWMQVVETYTEAKLTKESDILPAISALASACEPLKLGKYIAGLWEKDLLCFLCWRVVGGSTRPISYTAPSFSWASQRGKIEWGYDFESPVLKFKALAKILSAHTTTLTDYRFGSVSDGFLEIRCILLPVTITSELKIVLPRKRVTFTWNSILPSHRMIKDRNFFFSDTQNDSDERYPRSAFCVPLVEAVLLGLHPMENDVTALVLEKTITNEPAVYQRVGLLSKMDRSYVQAQLKSQPRVEIKII